MASTHSTHALAADDQDESVHHEETDVNVRAISIAAIAFVVMLAAAYSLVYATVHVLNGRNAAASAVRAYPLAVGQENRLPPEPRLQTNPEQDLRDLRAAEHDLLAGYHWVDRNAGVVRIPIDDAMRVVLQRGLPARTGGAPPAAAR